MSRRGRRPVLQTGRDAPAAVGHDAGRTVPSVGQESDPIQIDHLAGDVWKATCSCGWTFAGASSLAAREASLAHAHPLRRRQPSVESTETPDLRRSTPIKSSRRAVSRRIVASIHGKLVRTASGTAEITNTAGTWTARCRSCQWERKGLASKYQAAEAATAHLRRH
jgi:hypothetical protein